MDIFNLKKKHFKVNLHTHTTNSDGKFAPEQIIDLYRKNGYDAIALTDHYKTNSISKLQRADITVMSGIEMHPVDNNGLRLHLLCLGVPEDFTDKSKLKPQKCIDSAVKAGGICIVAHPYWTGMRSSDILKLKNISAIEVFNTSTRYIGKQFNMVHWDEILDSGWKIPAIAVDDTHRPRDFFQGWTVVCAKDKSQKSLVEAIKAGFSYSTMGPEFKKIDWNSKTRELAVECSPAVEIIIFLNKSGGLCVNVPGINAEFTKSRKLDFKTEEMSSFKVKLPLPEAGFKYARCQIKDSSGHYAWTNPVYIDK